MGRTTLLVRAAAACEDEGRTKPPHRDEAVVAPLFRYAQALHTPCFIESKINLVLAFDIL